MSEGKVNRSRSRGLRQLRTMHQLRTLRSALRVFAQFIYVFICVVCVCIVYAQCAFAGVQVHTCVRVHECMRAFGGPRAPLLFAFCLLY